MGVRRLVDLGGELTTIHGVGPAVYFDTCPPCVAAGRSDHSHVIPFGPTQGEVEVNAKVWKVWRHVSGDTIDTITLSPSYFVPSCGFHGFVEAGAWRDC